MGLRSTWLYSKRKMMPVFQFGGMKLSEDGSSGFQVGDLVAVYANPEEREVRFYKNSKLIGSNLPAHPLPAEVDRPLYMYAMVDTTGDTVEVCRFGPGEPYPTQAGALSSR